MLDGFAMDDVKIPVIRALHHPVAVCVAPLSDRSNRPKLLEPWGVMMGNASSSSTTAITLTARPGAWLGDVPLVPSGAVSDELAAWIRFTAVTPRSTVPEVQQRRAQ
jgi:hypothetical protein